MTRTIPKAIQNVLLRQKSAAQIDYEKDIATAKKNRTGTMSIFQTHTPGPWNINKDGRHIIAPSTYDFPHEQIIGRVASGPGKNAKQNAALIAAAPELLAVAEKFAKFLKDNGGDADYYDDDGTGWLSTAAAAIAKAKGVGQ
jgi:hypothetical protein